MKQDRIIHHPYRGAQNGRFLKVQIGLASQHVCGRLPIAIQMWMQNTITSANFYGGSCAHEIVSTGVVF